MIGDLEKLQARARGKKQPPSPTPAKQGLDTRTEPDWDGECDNCGASPIVPATGMCGPCTFGESETAGGDW